MTINILKTVLLVTALLLTVGCTNQYTKNHKQESSSNDSIATLWPKLESSKADSSIEKRIKELLTTMSLDRKIGQMIQTDINSFTSKDMKKYRFGAVLNGGGSWPHKNKHADAAEWIALSDSIWKACVDGLEDPIPPLWGTDAVHGHNNFAGATIFPHNIGLGATRDTALIYRIGQITAKEVYATGVNWNFAPTVAVVKDFRWGRTYESFSEDPTIVASLGSHYITGLQGKFGNGSVLATAKHFIGDGGTDGGDDRGDNLSSEEELLSIHAPGYIAALKAGVQVVMVSYSSWQGTRMHTHKYLLTDVLKNRLGFDGFVVSDWDGIETVKGCSKSDCPSAVNAGIDMFMISSKADWQLFFENLKKQVENGDIPMSRIDDAVSRILRVKIRMGLMEQKLPVDYSVKGAIPLPGAPEHRSVAREAVRKSLVLLKNNNVLPLDRNKRVLVTGRGADSIAIQAGGWTLTWQGTDYTNQDFPGATTILNGIKETAKNVTFDPRCDSISKDMYDVAIVVIGEKPYAEFKGDIEGGMTLEHAENYPEDIELLRKIKKTSIPVVTILLSGRPLCVNKELNTSDAFVAAWLPGSEGAGVADLLFRKDDGTVGYDFSGKLSFSWPKYPCQAVVNKNEEPQDPLFPLGYGLTYAMGNSSIDSVEEYSNSSYGCNGTVLELKNIDGDLEIYNGTFSGSYGGWMGGPDNWNGQAGNPDAHIQTLDVTMATDKMGKEKKALQFNFKGPAYWCIGGSQSDLSSYYIADYSLCFDVYIDSKPQGSVSILMTCNYPCQDKIDITGLLNSIPIGKWKRLRIPLKKFKAANFLKIDAPFQVSSTGPASFTIADIRLEK